MLKGIRVIEMASVITGPLAGSILCDLGADVIKVESPGGGDPFRAWSPGEEGVRASFAAFNRGKRSVTLDIKDPDGRRLYEKLVGTADVVIENFRPGRLDRLGVGAERLRALYPGLVYCDITGQGNQGPHASHPTYDAVAQALSGLWSQFTDLRDPVPVGPPAADQLTGIYAAVATLGALVARERTGEGQYVHVDMLAAAMSFSALGVAETSWNDASPDFVSRSRTSQTYAFVDTDGAAFAVHLSTPQKFWEGLCDVVGRPDLVTDSRFATKPLRIQNYDALKAILSEEFARGRRDDWLTRLARSDVPAAPLLTVAEAIQHPQVVANRLVFDGPAADGGGLVASPIIANAARCAPESRRTPGYGEHTDDVLAELHDDLDTPRPETSRSS